MTNECLGFLRKYLIEASLMDLSVNWDTFDSSPRCLVLPRLEPVQCWLPSLIRNATSGPGVPSPVSARTNLGRTVVRRVEVNEKLLKMAKEGWTLSRLWVMGHLGGVPNV